ncbi:MAG: nuclear transport factor 2 family protein [Acidobacteriota bacterium]|nr:nuclear transport factor 2 family protein [Acidobacteriota bacterium]
MKLIHRSLMLSLCCLALSSIAVAQTQAGQTDQKVEAAKPKTANQAKEAESAIRAVLDAQVTAWNAGKLEEFMVGYWRSPKLTFFSGGRKLESWDATLERYRKNYQSEGKEMGKLQFLDLDVQTFGRGAVVRGRYELTMSDGKKPTGLFTLVLRKIRKNWKIIHDHTSTN